MQHDERRTKVFNEVKLQTVAMHETRLVLSTRSGNNLCQKEHCKIPRRKNANIEYFF